MTSALLAVCEKFGSRAVIERVNEFGDGGKTRQWLAKNEFVHTLYDRTAILRFRKPLRSAVAADVINGRISSSRSHGYGSDREADDEAEDEPSPTDAAAGNRLLRVTHARRYRRDVAVWCRAWCAARRGGLVRIRCGI